MIPVVESFLGIFLTLRDAKFLAVGRSKEKFPNALSICGDGSDINTLFNY